MFEYGNNLSTGGHIGNTIRSMDSNKASTGGFQSVFNGAPFDIAAQVNNVFNNLSDEMACWLLFMCKSAFSLYSTFFTIRRQEVLQRLEVTV